MALPTTAKARGARMLATVLAGSAAAAALSAPAAHAAFVTPACKGADISGVGATFPVQAHVGWVANFRSDTPGACGATAPNVTYNPSGAITGSGAGRIAMGLRSAAGSSNPNPNQNRDANRRFAGTDEPPTPAQTLQMEQGPIDNNGVDVTPTDNGDLHVIPVAVGAVAVDVNFPQGCTVPTALQANAPADSTVRLKLEAGQLEKAFAADTLVDTWGELVPGITGTPSDANLGTTCAGAPIRRVVRQDDSGTTFALKDWLAKVNPNRGWRTTFGATPNTTWPNTVNESSAATCPYTSNLCKAASSGGGNQLTLLANAQSQGSIGYGVVADSRTRGFDVASATDTTFWVAIQNDAGGTAYDPSRSPNGYKQNGLAGSNCGGVTFTGVPATTLGDWESVSAAGGAGSTAYPACTVTYILAWDDYGPVYGLSADNEKKARTAKDYLSSIVTADGQADLSARDYAPLPTSLRTIAQNGVAAIGYNKADTGVVTPPAPAPAPAPATPAPTTPATGGTTPQPAPQAPSNVFTVASGRVSSTNLLLSIQVPGAGTVRAVATAKVKGKTVRVGSVAATASAAGTVKLTIKASSAAKKLLKKAGLKVSVAVTYTPTGGTAASKSKALTLKKLKAAKKK